MGRLLELWSLLIMFLIAITLAVRVSELQVLLFSPLRWVLTCKRAILFLSRVFSPRVPTVLNVNRMRS